MLFIVADTPGNYGGAILGFLLGFLSVLILRLGALLTLRGIFFRNFYRKNVAGANILFVVRILGCGRPLRLSFSFLTLGFLQRCADPGSVEHCTHGWFYACPHHYHLCGQHFFHCPRGHAVSFVNQTREVLGDHRTSSTHSNFCSISQFLGPRCWRDWSRETRWSTLCFQTRPPGPRSPPTSVSGTVRPFMPVKASFW